MTDTKATQQSRDIHDLIEDEFQQLVGTIGQKHNISPQTGAQGESGLVVADKAIQQSTQRLQEHSRSLGAETLTEYFAALEDCVSQGQPDIDEQLLQDIRGEFLNVRDILSRHDRD